MAGLPHYNNAEAARKSYEPMMPSLFEVNIIPPPSIGDGSFLNDSKWYGHIKRDFFGSGETYSDGYRFRMPPMATAVNAWTLEVKILAFGAATSVT